MREVLQVLLGVLGFRVESVDLEEQNRADADRWTKTPELLRDRCPYRPSETVPLRAEDDDGQQSDFCRLNTGAEQLERLAELLGVLQVWMCGVEN